MKLLHVKILGLGLNTDKRTKLYQEIDRQIERGFLITDESFEVKVLDFDGVVKE